MAPNPRRSQTERRATTRAALLEAALELFGRRGYHAVAIDDVAAAAGVTKGALYHQFPDKAELFAAVLDLVEVRVGDLLSRRLGDLAARGAGTREILLAGVDTWLAECSDPAIQQVLLLDGPAVLGWARWRQIGMSHGLGLVVGLLEDGVRRGDVPDRPVLPLAHLLIGALDEAALFVARAEDQDLARRQLTEALGTLIAGAVGEP